jgi:hypothetical protein
MIQTPAAMPMPLTQLWLTHIPVIISSFATLIIAWTGFRSMQRNLAITASKADVAANRADEAATKAATLVADVKSHQALAAAKADQAATKAAALVAEVKTTLVSTNDLVSDRLQKIQQISDDTHVLVNNAMGQQLRTNAYKARQLAILTKDPQDIRDANDADNALSLHMSKQARVDHAVEARVKADEAKAKADEAKAKT